MFKFKVVSTGQRVGNLTAEPQLIVNPKSNRFKLTLNAAKIIGVIAGDSVTVQADTESGLFAVYVASKRLDKDGNELMKDAKMSEERKTELTEAGEEVPQENVYKDGCKLGSHLEFGSSNAIAQTALVHNIDCEHTETISGSELGLDEEIQVAIFDYKTPHDEAIEESEEEAPEEAPEEEEN